jgi:hypothetical protein
MHIQRASSLPLTSKRITSCTGHSHAPHHAGHCLLLLRLPRPLTPSEQARRPEGHGCAQVPHQLGMGTQVEAVRGYHHWLSLLFFSSFRIELPWLSASVWVAQIIEWCLFYKRNPASSYDARCCLFCKTNIS